MSKYSIILPVRNGGSYVKDCVNSILGQTYTDFNFIVLDNCSTDGTLEWLQSLNDSRIVIIPSDKPLTIEENWGRIVSVQKNEFITLIGHDDILYPNFLEVIDKLVLSNPEASLFHTHFNFINAEGAIVRTSKPMLDRLRGYEFLEAFLKHSIDLMGTGYVMRSKDYDALNGIPIKYPSLLFADFELWLKLSLISYEAIAPDNCFAFRVHQSTTTTSQDEKLHRALDIFIDYLVELSVKDSKAKNAINLYGADFLLFYCKGFSHRLMRTPLVKRQGLTVNGFINYTKKLAIKLGVDKKYRPESLNAIKIAKLIDSNTVLSKLFLLFKKIVKQPIYKK